jgi:hypothetical protein
VKLAVLESLKREWRMLRRGEPGSRFQRLQQARDRNVRLRWIWVLVGAILVAVGLVGLLVPGPGLLAITVGVALVARESLRAARLADWIEVRGRSLVRWGTRWWRGSAP